MENFYRFNRVVQRKMEKAQKPKNPEAVRIGNIIKDIIGSRTQKEVAYKWKLPSQGSISAWVNGEYCPSIESLHQIAKAEGLTMSYFFPQDPENIKKETELFSILRSYY